MIRPRKQPDICQGTCSLTFRQYSTEDTDFSSVISIHAPAEGASKRGFADWQNKLYFNPRSRGGSDGRLRHSSRKLKNFNPRSRGGSDKIPIHLKMESTRYFNPRSRGGSDTISSPSALCTRYFNPRSRGGSDSCWMIQKIRIQTFQSTLPRRERPIQRPALQIT